MKGFLRDAIETDGDCRRYVVPLDVGPEIHRQLVLLTELRALRSQCCRQTGALKDAGMQLVGEPANLLTDIDCAFLKILQLGVRRCRVLDEPAAHHAEAD